MAKKKVKHQSFRLTPPNKYSRQQVYIYVAIAFVIGLAIGYLLRDQTMAVLGISAY